MTLADIKNHVYRRTKTDSTRIPAADMLIMVNNAQERVETKIREWVSEYNFTRWTSGDLSTGTAVPKFNTLFHELIPLWVSYQWYVENANSENSNAQVATLLLREIQIKESEMERWYGMHSFRVGSVTIATPGVFTLDNHKLSTNDRIILETSGALPTGLSADTWYYVIYTTEHTFKVSSTRDGSAINTTGSQSGTHFVGVDSLTNRRLIPNYHSNK